MSMANFATVVVRYRNSLKRYRIASHYPLSNFHCEQSENNPNPLSLKSKTGLPNRKIQFASLFFGLNQDLHLAGNRPRRQDGMQEFGYDQINPRSSNFNGLIGQRCKTL